MLKEILKNKNMNRAVFISVMFLFLGGCVEKAAIKTAALEVEQSAITANDLQLKYSAKGLCSSAYTAVMRAYAAHPKEFQAFMTLCDVDDSIIKAVLEHNVWMHPELEE